MADYQAGDKFICDGKVLRVLGDGRLEVELASGVHATVSPEHLSGVKLKEKARARDAADESARGRKAT